MADAITFKFVGGKELEAALNAMPLAVERKLGRQALRMGGKVLQKHLEAAVPVDLVDEDGVHLRDSIRLFRPRGARGSLTLRLGYVGKSAIYGPIIEFGNSRITANPVWRRGAAEKGAEVVQRILEKLRADLAKEWAKAAKRVI